MDYSPAMPRERSFSPPEVLDRVADAFTAHGYGGTSMAVLTDVTGLGKQSLYNGFGDKQALYLQAVDCAVARFGGVAAAMQAAKTGRAAIEAFFEHLVGLCASGDPTRRNCIVSAGLMEGIDDAVVQLALRAKWQATHELLRAALERGQRDASIRSRAPSAALADLLMSVMSGLRVTAHVDAAPARLQSAVTLALEVLDHP
jgi:TetR/AcrR family transcriptional regulator, transcriptional repressor for nem operon